MNLIVSDFDGTFYDNNYLENIKFIESIKDSYDFVIATGRNYKYLKKDLNIDCKYYICNDGGYILDNEESIIYKNDLDKNSVRTIYNKIVKMEDCNYYFDNIDYISKQPNENINKIIIKRNYKDDEKTMNYLVNGINNVYAYLSENSINISDLNSKKSIAIEQLLKLNKYDKVYVIGNETNDYDMLKKYNGYLISEFKNNYFKTINNFIELKKELL